MDEVARSGRTVLFVSHQMSAIQALTSRCILLDQGKIIGDASTNEIVEQYLSAANQAVTRTFEREVTDSTKPQIISARILRITDCYPASLEMMLQIVSKASGRCSLDVHIKDASMRPVAFGSLGAFDHDEMLLLTPGITKVHVSVNVEHLAYGDYFLGFDLTIPNVQRLDRLRDCLRFEMTRPPRPGRWRIMNQAWGYGCCELSMTRIDAELAAESNLS